MFPISSTDTIEGKKITANDGVVVSWGEFAADADDAARQEAWDKTMQALHKKAKFANANGIIDFKVKYTPLGDGSKLLLTMTGTAVSVGKD